MNKYFISALSLATLFCVACDDESYDDYAAPITNAPEAAYTAGFTVTSGNDFQFANIADEDTITLFTPALSTTAEGVTPTATYSVLLNNQVEIATIADGKILASTLKDAVVSLYGRAPEKRTLGGVVTATIDVDGMAFKATDTISATAQLVAPVIEEKYYVIGTCTGWAGVQTYELTRANSDVSVYDDPVFTATIPASVDTTGARVDEWIKIAPLSCFASAEFSWDPVLGCVTDGDESLSGSLVNAGAGAIKQPATDGALYYQISLDMMNYTYTITPLAYKEFIYVPGNGNGWSPETAPALRSPNSDGVYTGYAYMNGEFKFTLARDWTSEYNYTTFTTYSDVFTSTTSTNIGCTTEGYYYFEVNHPAGSVTATQITAVGIIGDFNSWGTDVAMTFDAATETWSATVTLDGGGWKFRMNNDWAINLGGTADNLSANGDNLTSTAGTYVVTLHASRKDSDNMYCTVVAAE